MFQDLEPPSPPKIKLAMLGYNPMNGLIETGKFGTLSVQSLRRGCQDQ